MEPLLILALVLALWIAVVFATKRLHLDKRGLDVHPLYIIYRSTRLNNLLFRMASWNPAFWRVLGDVAVAFAFGQMLFLGWTLITNLLRFFTEPSLAFPVFLTIPGITVRVQSLPYFLASVSVCVFIHELSHGILCAAEGVPVRNSALVFAVIFLGGAIEPDEEELKRREAHVKMRIYAIGSLTNLIAGLLTLLIVTSLGENFPNPLLSLFEWFNFLSINLAIGNMLPVYPLDGYGVVSNFFDKFGKKGAILMRMASFGFLILMFSNVAMSFAKFGLTSL